MNKLSITPIKTRIIPKNSSCKTTPNMDSSLLPEIIKDISNNKTYTRLKLLGKGGFAKCYLATDDESGLYYAFKVFDKSSISTSSSLNRIKRELEIHCILEHKNIVKYYGHFEDEHFIYVKLEYCNNQTLNHLLMSKTYLEENEIRYYMRQAACGLAELHSKYKVIHRDLKPSNLLMNIEMTVKIADFGLSVQSNQITTKQSICGTPNYMSPEVVQAKGAVFESDIWSFGCVLYYLFVGRQPFSAENTKKIYEKISNGDYVIPKSIPLEARNLINHCLKTNSSERPNAFQIINHKFFNITTIDYGNKYINNMSNLSITNHKFSTKTRSNKLLLDLIDILEFNLLSKGVCKTQNCIESYKNDVLWVTKWVDFTNQHGFGVHLSNGSTCVVFNDKSIMTIDKTSKILVYCNNSKTRIYSAMANLPSEVSLKLEVVKLFYEYMDRYLMKGGDMENINQDRICDSLISLNKWIRNNEVLVMELSDGTTQINFLNDHSKLIFSSKNSMRNQCITYIDRSRSAITIDANHLNCFKYSYNKWEDFYERLNHAKSLLNHLMLSDLNGYHIEISNKDNEFGYLNQKIIQGIVNI